MKTYFCENLIYKHKLDEFTPYCLNNHVSLIDDSTILILSYGLTMTLDQVCAELHYTKNYVMKALYTKNHKLGQRLRCARLHENKNALFITELIYNILSCEEKYK